MLKKIIAISAIFALFACSSDNDDSSGTSSSTGTISSSSDTGDDDSSSSSAGPTGPIEVTISLFRPASINSEPFKSYPYNYTQRGGEDEDLTQFWNIDLPECPIRGAVEDDNKAPNLELCQKKNRDNAVLQNELTNRHAPLRYKVDGILLVYPNYGIEMQQYNLTGTGDAAALGLNVDNADSPEKNIEELGNASINGTTAFIYRYRGGAHEFRIVSKNDDDFWYFEAEASVDFKEVEIPINELGGMGSFAANDDGKEVTPFDVSKVAKFLWVVEYKDENPDYNTGSLLIDYLKAKVER